MTLSLQRCSVRLVLLTICASLAPASLPSQDAASREQARFIADARVGTRRYVDQQHAIDDGFTRVGVEFPAMGEHWVSLARVMENAFDAKRPSILIYSNTAGGPRLAGVAYSRLLRGREEPPPFPFAGAWHEHSGTVTEGSLPLSHITHKKSGTSGGSPADDDAPRFFVLHAWIWTANPEGIFVTDNWSLPQHRLGLPTVDRLDRSVVRALSLAEDEDEYYRLVLGTMLSLSEREDAAVARVIDTHRVRAKRAMATTRAGERLTLRTVTELRAVWDSLWTALEGVLPKRRVELRGVREQV